MLAGLVQPSCLCCSRARFVAMHGQKGRTVARTQHSRTCTNRDTLRSRDVLSNNASVGTCPGWVHSFENNYMPHSQAQSCCLHSQASTLRCHTASLLLHWPQPIAQQPQPSADGHGHRLLRNSTSHSSIATAAGKPMVRSHPHGRRHHQGSISTSSLRCCA